MSLMEAGPYTVPRGAVREQAPWWDSGPCREFDLDQLHVWGGLGTGVSRRPPGEQVTSAWVCSTNPTISVGK